MWTNQVWEVFEWYSIEELNSKINILNKQYEDFNKILEENYEKSYAQGMRPCIRGIATNIFKCKQLIKKILKEDDKTIVLENT